MNKRKYPTYTEKSAPSKRNLELINKTIKEIKTLGANDSTGWFDGYAKGCTQRLASDLDLIEKEVPKNAKICECGAAPFVLTKALSEFGYEVYGIDINPKRFAFADKLRINLRAVDIEKDPLPFSNSYFDAVIFNELFEHLRIDLIFTLKELFRVLSGGGVLYLSTPNLKSIHGIFNFLLKNKSYSCAGDLYWEWNKIDMFGHMGHVREYTEIEVVEFLQKIGFHIDKAVYRGEIKITSWKGCLLSKFADFFPKYKPVFSVVATKRS